MLPSHNLKLEVAITDDDALWGLGLDWVSGNVYAVSDGGFIIACNGTGSLRCVTVLSGLGELRGIAVDSIEKYFAVKELTWLVV